jgi:nicotinate-nucleotide--dimethylbenzimidazole phosphoribosyltransferase
MSNPSGLDVEIDFPDYMAELWAPTRWERIALPSGSMGELQTLSKWLCSVQGICPPNNFRRARVVIFAGDHGVAERNVSALAPASTLERLAEVRAGTAAVNILAEIADAGVRIEDISVDADDDQRSGEHRIRRSSESIDVMDAMAEHEAIQALHAGLAIANDEVDSGADLLIAGDLGRGSTSVAAALISVLTEIEPVRVIGRGSGIDDDAWMRKASAVRDARRRAWPYRDRPIELLATAGGADIAALAGFLLGAAARRTPVLLDGVVVAAAALIANELNWRSARWWQAGQRSSEPGYQLAMQHLALTPILDLGVSGGSATGALLAVPVLRAAARLLSELPVPPEAEPESEAGSEPDPTSEPALELDPSEPALESGPESGLEPEPESVPQTDAEFIETLDDPPGSAHV